MTSNAGSSNSSSEQQQLPQLPRQPPWEKPNPSTISHIIPGLKVMNSLTRQKEDFMTMDGSKHIRWYMYVVYVVVITFHSIPFQFWTMRGCVICDVFPFFRFFFFSPSLSLSLSIYLSLGVVPLSMHHRIWVMPERI